MNWAFGMTSQPPICNYEGSDYQSSFWDHADRAYEDRVEAIALGRLLPDSGKLLLELGAGAGRNTPRYQGFERVVLLDYSLTQLQQAQERLGRSGRYVYVAANIYRLPFVTGLFDGATMIRVLHHMADAPSALVEVRRVMQTGGIFVLEYANKFNLKTIFRYLLGRQKWSPFTPEPIEFASLNFDFHPRTVRDWLQRAGFTLERQLTVSHFRLGLLKRWVPLPLLVALDSIAQLTGNWWQLTPSVFTRNRAVGNSPVATSGSLFRCLNCDHAGLEQDTEALRCPDCGSSWPIRNGIYDFRSHQDLQGQ